MGRIFVVGTADTKGEELAYLRAAVAQAGRGAIAVDFGIGPPRCDVDIAKCGYAKCGYAKCGYQCTGPKGLGGNSGFQCTTCLASGNCPK
jgi:uncharacterized protein (UPF0261 family)